MVRKFAVLSLILPLIMILSGCQGSGEAASYIVPLESENLSERAFRVTVPEDQRLTIYAEQWKDGSCVRQEALFSCSDGTETIESLVNPTENGLSYALQSSSGLNYVEFERPAPGILQWEWLTQEEQEEIYAENPSETILFVLSIGKEGEGSPAMVCGSPILDDSFFTHYQEVQLIRAELKT